MVLPLAFALHCAAIVFTLLLHVLIIILGTCPILQVLFLTSLTL